MVIQVIFVTPNLCGKSLIENHTTFKEILTANLYGFSCATFSATMPMLVT